MMRTVFLCLVSVALCSIVQEPVKPTVPESVKQPEANPLPICRDLVAYLAPGLNCEEYVVQTEDGYLLNVIRLPAAEGAPVAYLQHGLLDSAATFFGQNAAENIVGLGYALHNAGYDVWAANIRGNWYSLSNTHLNPTEEAFWDGVDWDTMAQFDVPAVVDFALKTTGASKLSYVAHSQGTTLGFISMSENYGNLKDKVNVFVALAPVAYLKNQANQLFSVLAALHTGKLLELFGTHQFPPLDMDTLEVLEAVDVTCATPDEPMLCQNILYDIEGATPAFLTPELQKTLLGFDNPSGTSITNLQHWFQAIRTGDFAKFDYGWWSNLLKYGTFNPPAYEPKNLQVPVGLFYGGKDEMTAKPDVERLLSEIPEDKKAAEVELPEYAHLDFVWSSKAGSELYPQVVELLGKYNQ